MGIFTPLMLIPAYKYELGFIFNPVMIFEPEVMEPVIVGTAFTEVFPPI